MLLVLLLVTLSVSISPRAYSEKADAGLFGDFGDVAKKAFPLELPASVSGVVDTNVMGQDEVDWFTFDSPSAFSIALGRTKLKEFVKLKTLNERELVRADIYRCEEKGKRCMLLTSSKQCKTTTANSVPRRCYGPGRYYVKVLPQDQVYDGVARFVKRSLKNREYTLQVIPE
jgi:hypothetical protein